MSNHTYTKKIGGDSIDLFLVFQVERETVMKVWRLHWRLSRVRLVSQMTILKIMKNGFNWCLNLIALRDIHLIRVYNIRMYNYLSALTHSLTYGRTLCTHSHREVVAPIIEKFRGS